MDFMAGNKKMKLELNELEELRLDAYEKAKLYKERMKILHGERIIRR